MSREHDHDELIAVARQLPYVEPDDARREDVRTALLAAARTESQRPPRRARVRLRRWAAAPVIAAAAAAIVLFVARSDRPSPTATPKVATVEASEGAHFVHESRDADEVVRLTKGRVTVDVQKLHGPQRFRVITSDAEVEVHGTSFDVDVVDDRLREVVVHHGLVEVRPKGRPPLLLSAGERWTARIVADAAAPEPAVVPPEPEPEPDPELEPAPAIASTEPEPEPASTIAVIAPEPTRARPRRVRAATIEPSTEPAPVAALPDPVPEPAAPAPADESESETEPEPTPEPRPSAQPTDAELAFEQGWKTLRAGNYGDAADAFARVIALEPDGDLVEDARYWRAIAMARAGRGADARLAMARFLAKHPEASRAGEVSAMLGWLLLDAGDRASARQRFEAAIDDPDPRVRDSARAGLSALEQP